MGGKQSGFVDYEQSTAKIEPKGRSFDLDRSGYALAALARFN
jgi:hypothetical protein